VASAGSPTWPRVWLYGRAFFPHAQTTVVHFFLKRIPFFPVHLHISEHHISMALVQNPLGTQKLLLDMVASPHCTVSSFNYPDYIMDELLVLLGNIFEGQTGPHIDSAVQWLTQQLPPQQHLEYYRRRRSTFWAKTLGVITRAQARSS